MMKSHKIKQLAFFPIRLLRFAKRTFERKPDAFLRRVSGVVHVGANTGQEREIYAGHNLDVVWIEPIPEVFSELQANLEEFPRQRAYQCLITDRDGEEYTFHIANNEGQSSSILELELHRDIWAEIYYESSILLKSVTLASLVKMENIKIDKYDALIMDTQGTELLVLKGAESLLSRFKYIKTEAADFEVYKGCCRVGDLEDFLGKHGFEQFSKRRFAARKEGGACYDIVYKKANRRRIKNVFGRK